MYLKRIVLIGLAAVMSAGCAPTHQVVMKDFDGLDEKAATEVKKGFFPEAPDVVFEAAAKSIEREPFKTWKFEKLDKADGWISVSAAGFHHADIRVSSAGESGSQVTVSYNESSAGNATDIYVPKSGEGAPTAYLPEKPGDFDKVPALYKLDKDYFLSHIYRILHKMGPVPFELEERE